MTKRLFAYTGITMLAAFTVVFYFGFYGTLTVLAFAVIASVCAFAVKAYKNHRSAILTVAVTALLSVLYFGFYTNMFFAPVQPFDGKEGECEAVVTEIPRKSYGKMNYELESVRILDKNEKHKILAITSEDLGLKYGDRICFAGKFEICDYSYYNSFGYKLMADIDCNSVKVIGDESSDIRFLPLFLREKLSYAIGALISSPESEVCRSIALGEKHLIPGEIRSDFSSTGLSYIIVVSGLHLHVIASAIIFLFGFVGNKRKSDIINFVVTAPVVLLYMEITGMYAPVVRSTIMVLLWLFGKCIMRTSDNYNNLGVAAIIITAVNPLCVGNIGALMSFASMLGIFYFEPRISGIYKPKFFKRIIKEKEIIQLNSDKKLINKSKRRVILYQAGIWILGYFTASCAAVLVISPLTLYAFGSCNPSVVLSSVLVTPFVAALMICALLSAVFYYIPYMSVVAEFFAFAAEKISWWIISVVKFSAKVPYTKLYINPLFVTFWLVLFGVLVFAAMHFKNRVRMVSLAVAVSLFVTVCFSGYVNLRDKERLSLKILNSGNGITAFIKDGDSGSVLSCGGSYGSGNLVLSELHYSAGNIDFMLVPSNLQENSVYMDRIINEFDVKDLMMYYKCVDSEDQYELAENSRYSVFTAETELELNLTGGVSDYLVCRNGHAWQYINSKGKTVLIAPQNGKAEELPKKFRSPDYLVLSDYDASFGNIDCGCIIWASGETVPKLNKEIIKTENGTVSIDLG